MKQRQRTYLVVLTLSVLLAGLLLAFWLWPEPETEQEPAFRGILRVSAMALSPDNKQLLVGYHIGDLPSYPHAFTTPAIGDKFLAVWDFESGDELFELKGHKGSVFYVAFLPGGFQVVSASEDRTITLWNLQQKVPVKKFTPGPGIPWIAALSPNGKQLVMMGKENRPQLWDVFRGELNRSFEPTSGMVQGFAFCPSSRFLFSAGHHTEKSSGTLWDLATGKTLLRTDAWSSWMWAGAFSPNGKYLLIQRKRPAPSYDSDLLLIDPDSGHAFCTLERPSHGVRAAFFTPDCKYILTASETPELSILRLSVVETGKEVWYQLSSIERMVLSSDGKFAITQTSLIDDPGQGTATGIRFDIWDVATGKRLRSIIRRPALDGTIH